MLNELDSRTYVSEKVKLRNMNNICLLDGI